MKIAFALLALGLVSGGVVYLNRQSLFAQPAALQPTAAIAEDTLEALLENKYKDGQSTPDSTGFDSTQTALAKDLGIDSLPAKEQKRIMEKITKEYLMGRFEPSKDERFAKIPAQYANAEGMYMRKEALEDFKKMWAAAQKDGISLKIVSATRNFNAQKAIWEAKWNSKKPVNGKMLPPESQLKGADRALQILLWNSMPSTSRHHWGTDIDINSVNPEYFAQAKGEKEYKWLVANAPKFGFCQVYSKMGTGSGERPHGYQEEKWHWSYIPVSRELTQEYAKQITDKDIDGFIGAQTALSIGIVEKYVLGINPECK